MPLCHTILGRYIWCRYLVGRSVATIHGAAACRTFLRGCTNSEPGVKIGAFASWITNWNGLSQSEQKDKLVSLAAETMQTLVLGVENELRANVHRLQQRSQALFPALRRDYLTLPRLDELPMPLATSQGVAHGG
jgi:hypothetical protein